MKIVFCHNVYVRYNTLYNTLKVEKQLFPDSHSIIAYNDIEPPSFIKKFNDTTFVPFNGKTHKIGCANGCITSIQEALNHNPTVIVFSHDDVFISEEQLHIFNRHVESINKGFFDFIGRMPGGIYGKNYYMMECFFLSAKAAKLVFENKPLFENELNLPKDIRGSISPEVFLHDVVNVDGLKLLTIDYDHKLEGYNDTLEKLLGHHHLNAGTRGWEDKKNV